MQLHIFSDTNHHNSAMQSNHIKTYCLDSLVCIEDMKFRLHILLNTFICNLIIVLKQNKTEVPFSLKMRIRIDMTDKC